MNSKETIGYNKEWEANILKDGAEVIEEYMDDKWIVAVMNHTGFPQYYLVTEDTNSIDTLISGYDKKDFTIADTVRVISGQFASTMSVYGFTAIILIGIEQYHKPIEISIERIDE